MALLGPEVQAPAVPIHQWFMNPPQTIENVATAVHTGIRSARSDLAHRNQPLRIEIPSPTSLAPITSSNTAMTTLLLAISQVLRRSSVT